MRNTIYMYKFTMLIVLFTFFFTGISAQNLPYDKITIDGKPFYTYNVKPGEGLMAIARTFSVTVDDILRYNPAAKNGLMNGQVLNIPIKTAAAAVVTENPVKPTQPAAFASEAPQAPITPFDQNNTFKHTVSSGETVYSLANTYNTTEEEIYRYNPSARDGIRIGEVLTIPQRRTISENKEENYRYHTILPKETLYSVSKTYQLKPEDIITANPGLSVETFQIGKIIRVPFFETNETFTPYNEQVKNVIHEVKQGETLYGIARQYNVTQDEIEKANPILSAGLRVNMRLIIPTRVSRSDQRNQVAEENQANQLLRQTRQSQRLDVIKVGLLMPFLDESQKAHLRLQEYYEGFLLAVKKMKDRGANIELYVFEIGKGSDTRKLQSLLGTMEMQNLDVVIGGTNDAQIKVISDFAKAYNVKYVVPFSMSNKEVLNNGQIFQVNPMESYTYSKASQVFTQNFRNANVVFLNVPTRSDKSNFVSTLQSDLRKNNIKYDIVTVDQSLDKNILPLLTQGKENILVPTTGDRASLRQILDALLKVQSANPGLVTRLFGYPEWQTYDSKFKSDYYKLGTYIFTTFFVDENDLETKEFNAEFRKWYKRDVMDLYPRYGMWGYDTGLFFITALQQYGKNFEQNVNNVRVSSIEFPFYFERVNNWGGFVNAGLYLVYYDPNRLVIKTDKSR